MGMDLINATTFDRGIWASRAKRYPLRTCLYLNHCALCDGDITDGQRYYDGGYGRRAHVECVERAEIGV